LVTSGGKKREKRTYRVGRGKDLFHLPTPWRAFPHGEEGKEKKQVSAKSAFRSQCYFFRRERGGGCRHRKAKGEVLTRTQGRGTGIGQEKKKRGKKEEKKRNSTPDGRSETGLRLVIPAEPGEEWAFKEEKRRRKRPFYSSKG